MHLIALILMDHLALIKFQTGPSFLPSISYNISPLYSFLYHTFGCPHYPHIGPYILCPLFVSQIFKLFPFLYPYFLQYFISVIFPLLMYVWLPPLSTYRTTYLMIITLLPKLHNVSYPLPILTHFQYLILILVPSSQILDL